MKKLFAMLSVVALTFALVGLTNVQADELFTEDPTLAENEIPVYIMGSIKTTFPTYYDNVAKADDVWQGAARQYPWNETRLNVKQVGADGQFTGKEYAIYFAGSTTPSDSAAGMNIPVLTPADNAYGVYLSRYDANTYGSGQLEVNGRTVKIRENAGPMDGSLSHATQNMSGKDLDIDLLAMANETGGSNVTAWAQQVYNRGLIYDGQGRAIWGNSVDGAYAGAVAPADVQFEAEYCYIDGVVTKTDDLTKCDRKQVAKLDELDQPVIDEATGEPVMIESEDPKVVESRFVFQWVPADEWETTYKERVNTVPYLANGWNPDLWDDAWEQDGGYMMIAFVNAAQSKFAISDEQAAAANAALVGTEEADKYAKGYVRKYVQMVRIPQNAIIFDFGYLDKGVKSCETAFVNMCVAAYKYGRQEGMARMTTHNFSAKPIYETDKVINGVSQQFLEGTNTIEIKKGTVITPAQNVTYTGIGRYWAVADDTFSYSSDISGLELYMDVNGVNRVKPNTGYTSMEALKNDFIADLEANKGKTIRVDSAANFHADLGWAGFVATNSTNAVVGGDYTTAFMNNKEMNAKWAWLVAQIYNTMLDHPGGDTYAGSLSHIQNAKDGNYCASPQTMHYALWYFLFEQDHTYFGFNFGNGNASEWIDPRTNAQIWDEFSIETADAAIDTHFVVGYKAVNPETGNTSTFTIDFVVVDEYTPIIEVAKADQLKFTPIVAENGSVTYKKVDGSVLEAIPANGYVTAYNGEYNGANIKGNDISYKVHYSSETLDFAAPTQGAHKVTVKVTNNTKYAEKTFTIVIEDVTAPKAEIVEKVTVAYGSLFNPYDLIISATDNVDGNLVGVDGAIIVKSTVDTTKAKDYTVSYTFADEAGNTTEKTAKVTVLANEDAKFEALQDALAAQDAQISDLLGQVEDLQAQLKALAESGCGKSSSATVMAGFFALTGLLVVVLKKRH